MSASQPLTAAMFAATVDAALPMDASRRRLSAMLPEQAALYDGRTASETARMRSYILAAFDRIGLPDAAIPYAIEELESGRDALLVAAAAKALRGAAPRVLSDLRPLLRRAAENIAALDAPLTFETFQPQWPFAQVTTAIAEISSTLRWLDDYDFASVATSTCCDLPPKRILSARSIRHVVMQDQTGVTLPFDAYFTGRPCVVVFFYTRCDNPQKCSLSISKLAVVQTMIEQRGLSGRIRLAAVTYDPAFDTPSRLELYGRLRGVRFGDDVRFFRTQDQGQSLRDWFDLGVNYSASLVNHHRIEVYLLSSKGTIAGSFTRLQWEPRAVVEKMEELAREPRYAAVKRFTGVPAALFLAILPKCPLCAAAYLGAFGATGLVRFLPPRPLVTAALLILLSIHMTTIVRRSWRIGRAWAPFVSAIGSVLLLLNYGKSAVPIVASALLLTAGAVLSATGRRSSAGL